jgi:hypothetical protein
MSGHTELSKVPWALWGHSGGGTLGGRNDHALPQSSDRVLVTLWGSNVGSKSGAPPN